MFLMRHCLIHHSTGQTPLQRQNNNKSAPVINPVDRRSQLEPNWVRTICFEGEGKKEKSTQPTVLCPVLSLSLCVCRANQERQL